MKIKDNPPTAVPLTQSDIMDNKSYTTYSKPRELIDVRMDALGEEDRRPQGTSNSSAIGTQCGADSAIVSTMGEFDVGVMPPFYGECERDRETSTRNMTVGGDSSGDETFAAEMLSPSASNYGIKGLNSPMRWSNRPEQVRHDERRNPHVVGATSDVSDFEQQRSDHSRCSRVGRRFLSSETIRTVSDCRQEDNNQAASYRPINYSRTGSRHTSGEFSSNGGAVKDVNSNPFGNSFEPAPASGSSVMREIDLAVSMAHSRFKNVSPQPCDVLPDQTDMSPDFAACDISVTRNDNRRSSDAVIALRASQHADASSMTKNYASHSINARSAEDEWKRKLDYGSACPAVHELKATFEQSGVREPLGRRSFESSETYSARGSERNQSAVELVPPESASSEPNGLAFETKINSDHDERNTASYSVGASLLHVQSSPREAYWPRMRGAYEKQVIVRSSGKNSAGGALTEALSVSEEENKPINLSLQQGKSREIELGPAISPQKILKAPEFRKCARSFSSREKPYQLTKRRTRSQCSISPGSSGPSSSFDRGFVGARPTSTRQAVPHDMGINNRSILENYSKDSASRVASQGLTDSNSSLFSPNEASHMMVQDEAKTYAILSARRNEEMMNSHGLPTSGSPLQQPSLFHQPRHSHSIINYVGHHGQSPDMRPSEMSPSPPVRDHRATPSSSLPGIASSNEAFHNVIVGPRHNQHSASPSSRDDFRGADVFQRQYDSPHFESAIQDSRHQLHQHHSLAMGHHPSTSTFSPLHIPHSQHHPQQPSQIFMRNHQALPAHGGLGTSSSMVPYAGSLRVTPHHGYLKPPPVDLDDLSEDERERMRVKRERNRVAAAKCRNRRRELLERLEKEAEQLEREQELLRENVRRLRVQKLQLGNMLEEHETSCQKNVAEETVKASPTEQDGGFTNDDQPKSASSGGLESGESSTTKNTASPVQLSTQA